MVVVFVLLAACWRHGFAPEALENVSSGAICGGLVCGVGGIVAPRFRTRNRLWIQLLFYKELFQGIALLLTRRCNIDCICQLVLTVSLGMSLGCRCFHVPSFKNHFKRTWALDDYLHSRRCDNGLRGGLSSPTSLPSV